MITEKKRHGGKREGSGRNKKEETISTGVRLNKDAYEKCKATYGRTLNAKINEFIKTLAADLK